MKVSEKDFLVINANDKGKKILVQVTSADPLAAVVCDNNKRDKSLAKHVEFEDADIVCNFGNKPQYGSSYGLIVEYVRSQVEHKPWESVRFFKQHNDTEKSLIFKSLDRVSNILEESRVFPHEHPIVVHIKEPKGPYDGSYAVKIKKEGEDGEPDIMTLKLHDFGNLDYVVFHELGHGAWSQLMNDEYKALWIKLFTSNISMIADINEKMKNMRLELIGTGTTREFMGDLIEEDAELFKHIIKHIGKQYNVKPMHINILIATGDDLLDIWPKRISAIPQATILVTEYATKAPEELFCESFAYHFHPQYTLPKSVQKLMDKTIASMRYGSNSRDAKDI